MVRIKRISTILTILINLVMSKTFWRSVKHQESHIEIGDIDLYGVVIPTKILIDVMGLC